MDVESGWTAVGPIGEKDVRRASTRLCNKAWSFNGGAQSGRLSGLEDHVSNGVVTTDTVAIALQPTWWSPKGSATQRHSGQVNWSLCNGTPSQ